MTQTELQLIGLLIGGVALLVFAISQVFLITSISTGLRPRFRSIPLFGLLRGQTGRAIESGRELHVSIGTGGISGEDVTTTLAGLQIVEYLADEAAASGVSPLITTADATALLLAVVSMVVLGLILVELGPTLLLWCVLGYVSVALSVFASIIPARKAARLEPIDIIRKAEV